MSCPSVPASPTSIPEALALVGLLKETLRPPSRNRYPGSWRSDRPQRWVAFAARGEEHDRGRQALKADAELFAGFGLQSTLLPDPKASLFATPTVHNIPDAPTLDRVSPVHGVLFLGAAGSGKTCLVDSLVASLTGKYPPRAARLPEGCASKSHLVPDACTISLGSDHGFGKRIPVVLTDTAPLEPGSGGSSSSSRTWAASLRDERYTHHAVVITIDATAPALWEDAAGLRVVVDLCLVLRRRGYTVVAALTRAQEARSLLVQEHSRRGLPHGGRVEGDPRGSYEEFVSRYLSKLCETLRHAIGDPLVAPAPFPELGATLLDVAAWPDGRRWREDAARRGSASVEVPNWVYVHSQLRRLLQATQVPPHCCQAAVAVPPVYSVQPLMGPCWLK